MLLKSSLLRGILKFQVSRKAYGFSMNEITCCNNGYSGNCGYNDNNTWIWIIVIAIIIIFFSNGNIWGNSNCCYQ